jgi:hypothetical protein
VVPSPGEYVADGAARQAAWVLTGERPTWPVEIADELAADARPLIREQYAARAGEVARTAAAGRPAVEVPVPAAATDDTRVEAATRRAGA